VVNYRFVVLLLALLRPVSAQILLNPPRDASVITVDVDLVNVLCSVRDKHGAYVKDLSMNDFDIREDGRRQEIRHFAREVDSPLTVALLLDVSGSVSAIIGTEKAAASRFFSEVLRPGDKALLVGFAQLIAVWQDFTPSAARLAEALDRAGPFVPTAGQTEYRPRGGTLLYDAVKLVARDKLTKQPGRKTMVLITDGEDNGSLVNLETAGKAAQQSDAVVYGIHYEGGSRSSRPGISGISALEKLSAPTGGRTFHVSKKTPLEAIFETIQEEMRSQYGLGYKSSNPATDGAFRRLEVKSAKSGLKVQVRSGYYAARR
jgi:VWFA-related protein